MKVDIKEKENQIITIFKENRIRKLSSKILFYEIKGPILFGWKKFIDKRVAFLKKILAWESKLYIRNSDYPFENQNFMTIDEISEETWLMPSEINVEKLLKELYTGSWEMYASDNPLSIKILGSYNLYKPKIIEKFMLETEVSSILISFHDDNPWFFATRE